MSGSPADSHETMQTLTLVKSQVSAQAVQQYTYDPAVIDQAVMLGDMQKMDPAMRVAFYKAVCLSAGLNPLTQPFTVLKRQDKTTWLYANSTCSQQLAKLHQVSFRELRRVHETILGEPLYRVEVTASTPDGRSVPSQAVVSLTKTKQVQHGTWPDGNPKFVNALDADGEPMLVPLRGEPLANTIMKCDTKAMRRAVLALIGLGWMATDYEGRTVGLNMRTGELIEAEATDGTAPRRLDAPSEQTKTLDDHISDLFGDRDTPPQDLRLSALGGQIDAGLAVLGATDPAIEAWWEAMRTKYAGLSPATLGLLAEQIQTKVAARHATRPQEATEAVQASVETIAPLDAPTSPPEDAQPLLADESMDGLPF